MSKIQSLAPAERLLQMQELCSCAPLGASVLADTAAPDPGEEESIPVASELKRQLQDALADSFPRSAPFSLLLLHVTQFEHIQMPPTSPVVHKKVSCHAPA